MKRFLAWACVALLAVGGALTFAACSPKPGASAPVDTIAPGAQPSAATTTATDGEFKVGLECAYAPFNWTQSTDANGAVQISGSNDYASGYDVEIAKLIAKGLNKKLVIVKTVWDGLTPAVQSGTIDAIIAGMSPTAERKETLDFTNYYYQSNLVIVVKADGKFAGATSLADFSGAKITAQQGTLHYTVIDQISGVAKQTASQDFPTMRVALKSGAIDGYVSEKPEGVSAQTADPSFKMIDFAADKGFQVTLDDISVSVGLKKGSALTEQINKILADITDAQRASFMENAIKNQPAAN